MPRRLTAAGGAGRPYRMLLLGVLALSGCGSEPLGPQPHAPVPCTSTSSLPAAAGAHLSTEGVRTMLMDAADRVAPVLAGGPAIADAVRLAATSLNQPGGDADCRALRLAADLLAREPDDPGTLPDRSVLALALELGQRLLASRNP